MSTLIRKLCSFLVFVVRALLDVVEKITKHSVPDTVCSDANWYPDSIRCNCSFQNHTICRVTELLLSDRKIDGSIPTKIGDLSYLRILDLSENKLEGKIPGSFSKLTKLEKIDLNTNNLYGTIPESFWNLSNLKHIDLSYNNLEGCIPYVYHKMKSLNILDLSSNWIKGRIPSQLGTLGFLTFLNLEQNLLSGDIPKELGNITSLSSLSLEDNMLKGEIPRELGNLRNLSYLNLGTNKFIGTFPASLQNCEKIDTVYITWNNLSGKIPDVVFKWKQLTVLYLYGNNLEAPLPKDKFQSLEEVQILYFSDLVKVKTGDSEFPDLSKLTSLRYLLLRNCSLSGPIPSYIWRLHLVYLDLSFNNLAGGIPASLRYQPPLYLYLRRNKLNGSLPTWLTNKNITNVDLSENNFTDIKLRTDNIPSNMNLFACCPRSNISKKNEEWLRNAHYCPNETLRNEHLYINCGGNSVTINESTYEADTNPAGASTFTMSNSKLWGFSSMGEVYNNPYIYNKTCNVTMDYAQLYQTARTAAISLKYYGFCLKQNTYIVKLHFAEIAWDADQFPKVDNRRIFDVMIKGTDTNISYLYDFNIEAEAGGCNKNVTKEFHVDVNDTLEISLYWSGKGSLYGSNPVSNGPLISAISVFPVPKKHKRLSVAAIAGITVSASFSIVLVLVLFWWLGWFGGKKKQDLGKIIFKGFAITLYFLFFHCLYIGTELKGIELYPGGVFNFRQIKAATQNFALSNKIGEGGFGSVYKGVLPKGMEIAVKQLSAKSRQGIREFVNEIGTISALQHPNLVRLMGCCVEDNQLLLIYEYMKHNSLDHALFGSEDIKLRLNWPTRVKICLGIAKGLAFLHEESKLKIIHRDIKTTNILLDEDLNAKISDFGFAKLFEEGKTQVVTRIAGTQGYMAPEYAMRGHLTTKADVYSFGVVTLEIVSGKNSASYRPDDQSVYLLDLAYVLQEKGNLLALLDPDLRSEYVWKEAKTILELAMLCTNPSPTLRPTMSEVVKILEGKTAIKTTAAGVPYSTDNFTMAKEVAKLSQSTQSWSDSQGGESSTINSKSVSKEIGESSFSTDNPDKAVMQQHEKSENEYISSADNSVHAVTK